MTDRRMKKYVQGLSSSKNAIGPRLFSVSCELPLKRPPASQRGSRSFGISCRSSRSARSASSRVTTTLGDARSHPRAVERGTPRSVAMVTSPVRRTRYLSRWSYCCCGRGVDGIRMMMGRSLTSLDCAKAPRDVARRRELANENTECRWSQLGSSLFKMAVVFDKNTIFGKPITVQAFAPRTDTICPFPLGSAQRACRRRRWRAVGDRHPG